jgi:hypothetical protein
LSCGPDLSQIIGVLGAGTLFAHTEHSWYVRSLYGLIDYRLVDDQLPAPKDERETILAALTVRELIRFIDLVDGRCVMSVCQDGGEWIVLGRPPRRTSRGSIDCKEVVVIAKDLREFLQRILAAQGDYYFDDPNFIPDGVVSIARWA